MTMKERKQKVSEWCKEHATGIKVGASYALGFAVATGSFVLAKKLKNGKRTDAFVLKLNDGRVLFQLVRFDVFGKKYLGDSIVWSVEKAKAASKALLEASVHTQEELEDVSGWTNLPDTKVFLKTKD